MAVAKTRTDMIGTSASKSTITAGSSSTSSALDLSSVVAASVTVLVTYGGTAPSTDPLVEIFTSPDNSNFDTQSYISFYLAKANSATYQYTVPIRMADSVKYLKVKITNGTAQSADYWAAVTATTI